MRRTTCVHDISWKNKMKNKVEETVRKWVPDPRDRRVKAQQDRPSTLNKATKAAAAKKNPFQGLESTDDDTSLEDYMKKRDQDWMRDRVQDYNYMSSVANDPKSTKITVDGHTIPFYSGASDLSKEAYTDPKEMQRITQDEANRLVEIDEEKLLLRRQLQMDNEEDYRRQVAETKRAENTLAVEARKRMPHPADPNYDPFKNTPSYRPQDSKQLASWLKRQRDSGKTSSGLSLNTKEGEERFYNEEKMATQFHANPFAKHIERPMGQNLLKVTAYTPDSVFLDNKEIIGSAILTATNYYHWNVGRPEDITLKSLSFLLHMYPVPDVVFLGTGRNQYQVDNEITVAFQKRGSTLWCMPTPHALSEHSQQLDLVRRSVCAYIPPMGVAGYGTECFGDFVENDMFSLSDSQLGISADRTAPDNYYRQSPVAEKYRHMQGTGYGPKYYQLSDGKLVRPGTSGTKLRPMIEPGEDIEWEKQPSYFHWFPKETVHDYIENTTKRETAGKKHGDPTDKRLKAQMRGEDISFLDKGEEPEEDIKPWDSRSIPTSIIPALRDPKNIGVEDKKTGRVVNMTSEGLMRYKKMMQEREEGKEPSDPIEFDQERFVANKEGMIYDMSKVGFIPAYEGRWNPHRKESTGRGNLPFI